MDIHPDQAVLISREARPSSEIIAKARIRSKLVAKDMWAKDIMDQLHKTAETPSGRSFGQIQSTSKKFLRRWADQKWEERWKQYLVSNVRKAPAHEDKLGRPQNKPHQGLCKAESRTAIRLRTLAFAMLLFYFLWESELIKGGLGGFFFFACPAESLMWLSPALSVWLATREPKACPYVLP